MSSGWSVLIVGILLSISGPVAAAAEQNRKDERQAICQGREGARSWNHFLETACLADVVLRGIVKTAKGYKALLELPATKTSFTAETGALLYDGIVMAIDDSTVTIRQTIGMPARAWQASGSDEKQTRLITRRLGGAEGRGDNWPAQSGSSQTPQREKWVGAFVRFPGSRMLCRQHVTGAGTAAPHITWALYATDRPPSELRTFYAAHPGRERAVAPAVVQLRVGKKLLAAYPALSSAYPRCGVDPKPTDKTTIVVSGLLSSGQ